jgi:cardiolipin synthase
MSRKLIVLPDDSARPIHAAIEGAFRTLRVKMFVFSDPGLLKAVMAAKRCVVHVRVMLNPGTPTSHPQERQARGGSRRPADHG